MLVKKWGLALGGGGILAFSHLGVLEVMEKHGLFPDFISGCSAGALISGLYSIGKKLHEIRVDALEKVYETKPAQKAGPADWFGPISSLSISGIIQGNLMEKLIDKVSGKSWLTDAALPIAITSVDLISGKIVVFTNSPPVNSERCNSNRVYVHHAKMAEAIRASTSVPGIFAPKKMNDKLLVDGGILDMVPVYELRRMGAGEVIAVDLGTYADKPQKVDGVVSILLRSFALASRESTLNHLKKYCSLVLQPDAWLSGFPTKSKINALINAGRECAEFNMGQWKAIVARK
jgi:NTE family protein